jgi:hypothetical protein
MILVTKASKSVAAPSAKSSGAGAERVTENSRARDEALLRRGCNEMTKPARSS